MVNFTKALDFPYRHNFASPLLPEIEHKWRKTPLFDELARQTSDDSMHDMTFVYHVFGNIFLMIWETIQWL